MKSTDEVSLNDTPNTRTTLPYHEKQSPFNRLCLMHALNMLEGSHRLDQSHMDIVCDRLASSIALSPLDDDDDASSASSPLSAWILSKTTSNSNPHKGKWLGGNYDINVALHILENEWNYQASYFHRKEEEENNNEDALFESPCVVGLLVNVPGTFRCNRHWIMYKRIAAGTIDHEWYRLDSKASGPVMVSDIQLAVNRHLQVGDTVLKIEDSRNQDNNLLNR